MTATVDQPTSPTGSARSGSQIRRAEQASRKVDGERRLADTIGPHEEHRVGDPTPDHPGHRAERGGLSPGPGTVHGSVQAGSVVAGFLAAGLRAVGLRGAVVSSDATGVPSVAGSPVAASLRVARGFAAGTAGLGAAAPAATTTEPAEPVLTVLAEADPRVARDFVAGTSSVAGATTASPTNVAVVFAATGRREARCFDTGAAVPSSALPARSAAVTAASAGLRVARDLGAGFAAVSSTWVVSIGPAADTDRAGARLGAGFWAT